MSEKKSAVVVPALLVDQQPALLAGGLLYLAGMVLDCQQVGWLLAAEQPAEPTKVLLVKGKSSRTLVHTPSGILKDILDHKGSSLLAGKGLVWEQAMALLEGRDAASVSRVQWSSSQKAAVREAWKAHITV